MRVGASSDDRESAAEDFCAVNATAYPAEAKGINRLPDICPPLDSAQRRDGQEQSTDVRQRQKRFPTVAEAPNAIAV
jgi:hypothetical protein